MLRDQRPKLLVQAILPHIQRAYEEGLQTLIACISGETNSTPEERRNAGALLLDSMYQDLNLVKHLAEMPRIMDVVMNFASVLFFLDNFLKIVKTKF